MPETFDLGAEGLDRLYEGVRDLVAAGHGSGAAAEEAGTRGEGEAADGQIRAVVEAGGRLASLRADPRVMRLSSEELCAQIVLAVNAALDDLRDRVARAGGEVDHEALLARLRELQSDSVRQMESFAQSIGEIVGRIESRTER